MKDFNAWATDAIIIDFDDEIIYSYDQANVSHPVVFPTVSFTLLPTTLLCNSAKIKLNNLDADEDEFYFYIGINGFTKSKLNTCIEFAYGDEQDTIDLTEEEQEVVFAVLDQQCREKLGKSCDELLEEAKAEME